MSELEMESTLSTPFLVHLEIEVDSEYASVVLDEVMGDSPPPPGVLALFADCGLDETQAPSRHGGTEEHGVGTESA